MTIELLRPDWPVAPRVQACTSTRSGGCSKGAWRSLNIGGRAGDVPGDVAQNRARLSVAAELPAEPVWLRQVHGTRVVHVAEVEGDVTEADGVWTDRPDQVCAVQTADCMPVFLAAHDGSRVGVAHAGWRGLAAGVLERTVEAIGTDPAGLAAWLGPAIGPQAFEVGEDVLAAFEVAVDDAARYFRPARTDHWYADLYGLARLRLARLGVDSVGGGAYCTYSDAERFFSYRRDRVTGRMASMIWITE